MKFQSDLENSLSLGSLFSGIGGFELGFERTGQIKTIWQVEIDEYCRRVLAKHWPAVQRFADIRDVGKENLPPVDILCGGFPCQDISNAGKRAGIDGERSGLWSEYARVIRELRPRYVVVENVAALLGRGMERVLGDLAACGYDAEWQSIRASDVGAPHRRDRIWIIAYPAGDLRRASGHAGYESSYGRNPILADTRSLNDSGEQPTERQGRNNSFRGSEDSGRDQGTWTEALANANGGRFAVQGEPSRRGGFTARSGETVANTECGRRRARVSYRPSCGSPISKITDLSGESQSDSTGGGSIVANAAESGLERANIASRSSWWAVEPDVGRVAHGIPARVDRLRGLGNAIVPQIAEWIGHKIVADAFPSPCPRASLSSSGASA